MDNEHDTERLFVGRCALILFIGGLLGPFILVVLVLAVGGASLPSGARDTAYGLSVGLGLVAELLALILGTIGRRHLSGKTAQVGAIVLLVACVVLGASASAVWFVLSRPGPPVGKSGGTAVKLIDAPAGDKTDAGGIPMPKDAGR